MTLRLILVSIVACVGLSLPSAERLGRWTRSGQGAAGQNGVWHNGELLDEGRFVIVADAIDPAPVVPAASTTADAPAPAPSPEAEPAAAQTESTAVSTVPVPEVETVATEPKVDVDAEAVNAAWLAAIATEAAPPADTAPAIEVEPEALSADALAAIATEAAPPADTAEEVATVTLTEETEFVAPAATAVVAEDPVGATEPGRPAIENVQEAAAGTAVAQADADHAFGAVVDEMVQAFTKDSERVAAGTRPTPATAPVALAAPAVVAPSAESMVVDEEAGDPGDALARAAEGPAEPAAPATRAVVRRDAAVKHAMRLTREAVNAWASLLHGPALMTLGR